jgi:hypothetical protein
MNRALLAALVLPLLLSGRGLGQEAAPPPAEGRPGVTRPAEEPPATQPEQGRPGVTRPPDSAPPGQPNVRPGGSGGAPT